MSGALAGVAALPAQALGEIEYPSYDYADAKLYDATRCIGCRACGRRCREYNELPPDSAEQDGIKWDMPQRLSQNNFMILQAYKQESKSCCAGGSSNWSFIKKNCMHCNVPACAQACPVAALIKTEEGPVEYREKYCMGCRYCQLAYPYGVPQYEWLDRMPRVRKCTLCMECVEACPTGALKSGKRKELIAEAHQRIEENPGRYVNHVYGENEAGGASYLVLAGIHFEKFGLPMLDPSVRSSYAERIMRGLPGWVIGMGLFLGGLYHMEQRQRRIAEQQATEQAEDK
ncbi:MAG: 4Fe-4S dicluster domain-containing protein [Planctomycetota bacterium]|nr:MAG: 4Fe-4S dicluster domain-containing protein [Planctomycetota bacterium]